MRYFAFIVGLALAICASPAFAFDCRSPIVDQAHVITGSSVATAVSSLAKTGADVHVVTLEGLPPGVKKLSDVLESIRAQCPSWQSTSGKYLKSDMLVIGYAKPTIFSVLFGVDFQPKLGHGIYKEIAPPITDPAGAKYVHGDASAINTGLTELLNAFTATLSRPGGATGPVTIHQAADLKGLWLVLCGILLLIAGVVVWKIFSTTTDKDEERKTAQQEAESTRARAVSGLNEITDSGRLTVYEASASSNPAIAELVRRFITLGREGNALLARHDDADGANPTRERRTKDSYLSMKRVYDEILRIYVEPARDLARQIENGKPDDVEPRPRATSWADPAPTERTNDTRSFQSAPHYTGTSSGDGGTTFTGSPTSYPAPRYTGSPAPQTVVVQQQDTFGDAMLGAMIGESFARDSSYERERDLDRRERDLDRQEDRLDRREDRDGDWSRPETVSRASSPDEYLRDDDGGDISVDTASTWNDSGGDIDSGSSSYDSDSGSDL